jgi:uncharacterized repeat protein (TIGR04076 family)
MSFDERLLKIIKRRYSYNDEQLEQFIRNQRNEDVFEKINDINNSILKLTVIESHGCNSQHKKGTAFYFDGTGNILTKYCPSRICSYALNNAILMIFTANEFLYQNESPMKMKFKQCSCFDVGVKCGGLGQIIMELSVITKEEMEEESKV